MWSVGCILGELSDGQPLFPGESEIDQVTTQTLEMNQRTSCGSLVPEEKTIWASFKSVWKKELTVTNCWTEHRRQGSLHNMWNHEGAQLFISLHLSHAFICNCIRLLRLHQKLNGGTGWAHWDSYSGLTMVPVSTLTNPTSMKLLCHCAAFRLWKHRSQFLIHPSVGSPVDCYWTSQGGQF